MKILLMVNNKELRETLIKIISGFDKESVITTVNNEQSALWYVCTMEPDYIIVTHAVYEFNTYEFLKKVKRITSMPKEIYLYDNDLIDYEENLINQISSDPDYSDVSLVRIDQFNDKIAQIMS